MILVLDTNVISKAFSGKSPQARDRLLATDPTTVRIPSIVLAEIHYGLTNIQASSMLRERWDGFLAPYPVLDFTGPMARLHGQLRWELRHHPIGAHDLLIATMAKACDGTVITNNRREFDRVPGLSVEDWTNL